LRIIALALNAWAGPWMNRQQILSRLARIHPVLYSDGAWSTGDFDNPQWRRASWLGGFERRDGVLLDEAAGLLVRTRNHAWLDDRVLELVAARWRRRMRREGDGLLVAYVFHPQMWPYARALRADALVYHAYDLFRYQAGWSGKVAAFEQDLVRRAHVAIGSSQAICDELRERGARSPVFIPNGVDYGSYAIEPEGEGPADLAQIPRPRLGYIGKLSRKVDLRLVNWLSERHPEWQFVFVGESERLDTESAEGAAALAGRQNVHFLGFKDHRTLPGYAIRMDANIICHRLDDALWTKGTFPLKLFEYLAAGPPVVAADIPSVRPYESVVAIAQTDHDWERELTTIVESGRGRGTRESRRAVASQNTWDERVARLEQLLQGVAAGRP
jgi:glycosyltransferase involved in cell wall biosynthesis